MAGPETCDDGTDNNEGCSSGCVSGSLATWICSGGSPYNPTICTPNCTDGILVGNENCDTGLPF